MQTISIGKSSLSVSGKRWPDRYVFSQGGTYWLEIMSPLSKKGLVQFTYINQLNSFLVVLNWKHVIISMAMTEHHFIILLNWEASLISGLSKKCSYVKTSAIDKAITL